jgi:RNA-splicing ligase RtcB
VVEEIFAPEVARAFGLKAGAVVIDATDRAGLAYPVARLVPGNCIKG